MAARTALGHRRVGRRIVIMALGVVALLALPTGCGGDEPDRATDAGRAVCGSLQQMIDDLGADRSLDAVAAYDELVRRANDADDDSPIVATAREISSITDAEVDESKLLMSEVSDLARTAMIESGDALARLATECDAAGAPITGMAEAGAER